MKMIENYYYHDSDKRFKQLHKVRQVENKQAVCSVSLQPEYYAINNLEYHCFIK